MTNSVGSLASETVTINNDRELLGHFQMSTGIASSFIGRARQSVETGLGLKTKPSSNYFSPHEIHLLVTALRWDGRPFNAVAVRDYVDRTRLTNMPIEQRETYDKLIALLVSPAERLVLTGTETLIFLMSHDVTQEDEDFWTAAQSTALNKEISALIASLDDHARVYGLFTRDRHRKIFVEDFDVVAEHCVLCDDVMHRTLSILVYCDNEFNTYTFGEGGFYVTAPYQYWDYFDYARKLIAQN